MTYDQQTTQTRKPDHMFYRMKTILTLGLLLIFQWNAIFTYAQSKSSPEIAAYIAEFKADVRGPYKDIRWFCKDGTIRQPKDPCPDQAGNQRARYKDAVESLASDNHVFIGQILSTTPHDAFWDADSDHSRIKQYHLEKYLRSVDNGWILRKAQFYRGAFQSEDEAAWGADFFTWLLRDDSLLNSQFYLIRQATKNIPHRQETEKSYNVRALSKTISDAYPEFQDLRVKIHGQPEEKDISAVKSFLQKHQKQLSEELQKQFATLVSDMQATFKPVDLNSLKPDINKIPKDQHIRTQLNDYVNYYAPRSLGPDFTAITAEKIAQLRQEILQEKNAKVRLTLFDLSNALEEIFFIQATKWKPQTAAETAEKICYTGMAAMGCGYIEVWEWEEVAGVLANFSKDAMNLGELTDMFERSNQILQWGTGMVRGVYKDVVNIYTGFEPLANGFIDDNIRGSVLLPLGNSVGTLGDFIAKQSNITNQVLELSNQNSIRGLNPGIAKGTLVIIENEEPKEIAKDKIYVFQYAPSDLKPVAGILTVSEGNLVSHVQLLARNLGIPNAIISLDNLNELKKYEGQPVFYAVTNLGNVIIKPEAKMSAEEKELFLVKSRSEERISVPVDKIELNQDKILNLRKVDAASSGKVCGPKAANLGQLKSIFPDQVVEGIVLPFGVFRKHLNQKMPGQSVSYWQYLNEQFATGETIRKTKSEDAADIFMLEKLTELREAIKIMPLYDDFIADLEKSFMTAFGKTAGEIPVFLRSDTNMEDLKDFTGAGLNLTIFNAVKREAILQGIKDVWASPYTERSFRWRQRYLLNPENVFPSILIIPSVDVDCSGVLITKGLSTQDSRDITVAFSRGAGGAVDGQAAETYVLKHQGKNQLLSPAREPQFRRLPATGGTDNQFASFDTRILSELNLHSLRSISQRIKQEMPKNMNIESDAPLDVELGFKDDKIWLFQIRPFVENKNALSLAYLEKITPTVDKSKIINMTSKL